MRQLPKPFYIRLKILFMKVKWLLFMFINHLYFPFRSWRKLSFTWIMATRSLTSVAGVWCARPICRLIRRSEGLADHRDWPSSRASSTRWQSSVACQHIRWDIFSEWTSDNVAKICFWKVHLSQFGPLQKAVLFGKDSNLSRTLLRRWETSTCTRTRNATPTTSSFSHPGTWWDVGMSAWKNLTIISGCCTSNSSMHTTIGRREESQSSRWSLELDSLRVFITR